ncbi:MAG: hypothetical protein Q7W30_10815 [Coriobacteriia bacterium]|nr:hypothetical protein [Coriobacteriia bacterium]
MSDSSNMTPPPAPAPMGGPSSNAKLIALLGWIFAPWGIIAIFLDDYKSDQWVRSHVIQGAAVGIIGWILSSFTFGLGWVIVFIYQIVMALKANKGETVEVPVIYGLVKSFIEG